MSDRRVTKSGKDRDGDITKLCHEGQPWSPRSKSDAIRDIRLKHHRYYVEEDGTRAYIDVATHPNGHLYLRTRGDSSKANNLDSLPDC